MHITERGAPHKTFTLALTGCSSPTNIASSTGLVPVRSHGSGAYKNGASVTVHPPAITHHRKVLLCAHARSKTDANEPQVADLKRELSETHGVEYDAMTLIYGNEVRGNDMPLSDEEFVPNAPHDRCYIHIQVCDLEVKVRHCFCHSRTFAIVLMPILQTHTRMLTAQPAFCV